MVVGINEGVRMADGLPEGCRSMLSAAAPGCMLTPAGERHGLQEMVVTMLGEVLDSTRLRLQRAVDAGGERVAGAEAARGSGEAGLGRAAASLEARAGEVAAREEALRQTSEAVIDAESNVAQAQEAQSKGDADLAGAEAQKGALEDILARHICVLKEQGEEEAGGAEEHIGAIMPTARQLGVDDAFAGAISKALVKKPAERSGFDAGMIGELEANFRNRAAELASVMAAGATGSAERAAAVDAAQKLLGEAIERRQQAAVELSAAHAARDEAAAAVQAAEAASSACALEYERTAKEHAETVAELDNFLNYNMLCFTTLRDKAVSPAVEAGA